MNNEELEDGISIGELFAIVWARKIIIGAITLGSTIVLLLMVSLFVNPRLLRYEATYDFTFPGIETNKLPSGFNFDFRNFVSDENIEKVLENNEQFSYVNIDDIENGTISISQVVTEEVQNQSAQLVNTYKVSFKGNFFNSEDDAALFVELLISETYNDIIDTVSNMSHYTYLNNAEVASTVSFDLQLAFLLQQVTYLQTGYEELIEDFGNVFVNGKTLLDYQTSFNTYAATNSVSLLTTKLNTPVTAGGSDYIILENDTYLDSRAIVLSKNISVLEAKIDEMNSSSTGMGADAFNEILAELMLEKVELELELGKITTKTKDGTTAVSSGTAYNEFVSELEKVVAELEVQTNTYIKAFTTVYDELTVLTFENRNVVERTDEISIMLAAVVAMVLVGGVSCVAFVALDLNKKDKKEEVKA